MNVPVQPGFLDGPRGRLFALHFRTLDRPKAHVIYLPPFCEEMNRCRHLAAAQARRFAEAGLASLLLDPFGTGDSEGQLADATWDGWLDDVGVAIDWCRRQHEVPVILWGFRLGASLALDLLARHPDLSRRALLWQPVTDGKAFLTQVLRARIAALSRVGLPPETTTEIRACLSAGERVEVAGYVLGGALTAAIDSWSLARVPSLGGATIHWMQRSSRTDGVPAGAVRKSVDQLAKQGNQVYLSLFQTPQVWQLSERVDARSLLDVTSQLELI